MILVNGCSFTWGHGLEDPETQRWSAQFSKIVNRKVLDLSENGKSNSLMHKQIVTYLAWAIQGKKDMPKAVIWQTTDIRRQMIRVSSSSGMDQPNNFRSQVENISARYIRPDSYKTNTIFELEELREKAKDNPEELRRLMKFGVGSQLVYIDKDGNPLEAHGLVDLSYNDMYFQHLVDIITLQNLCKSLGVRLIILNYNPIFYHFKDDPLYETVDYSNFVLSNAKARGIYEHMQHCGFERFADGHFNMDAHLFQADIVADFYLNDKQFETIDYPFFTYLDSWERRNQEKKVIFDYT